MRGQLRRRDSSGPLHMQEPSRPGHMRSGLVAEAKTVAVGVGALGGWCSWRELEVEDRGRELARDP